MNIFRIRHYTISLYIGHYNKKLKGAKKMAKRKNGQIAVPFLVTIFIGLIIIGGMAYGVYRYLGLDNKKEAAELTPAAVTEVTEADSHTVLLILDVPEKNCPPTFILMRSMPVKKQVMFIGIPSNTIYLVNDQQQSILGNYTSGGGSSASDFIASVFDIKVDRYIKFDAEAFKKICDICGGVTYPVNADIAGFKKDGSSQYINSDQIITFLTYRLFQGGEAERAFTAASVLSSMVNQADGIRLADNLDHSFETVINMVDSNVTSEDYRKRKEAIKRMLTKGKSIALSLSLDGSDSGNDFIPHSGFLETVKEEYFTDKTS